ncbi:peptidase domain-containing ABC transporter, partial [Shewanella sp. 0m-11]
VEGSYISLARALLKQSRFIVLDEPIANRNPIAKAQLLKTFSELKGQATVLFTSHDQELIQQADKVVILDKGAVVYAGPIPEQAPQQPPAASSQENLSNG